MQYEIAGYMYWQIAIYDRLMISHNYVLHDWVLLPVTFFRKLEICLKGSLT